MTDNQNHSGSSLPYKTICSILLAIVGFFAVGCYNKMNEIQKDLVQIQVQLVEVQTKFLHRETVKEMIKDEIAKFHPESYRKH